MSLHDLFLIHYECKNKYLRMFVAEDTKYIVKHLIKHLFECTEYASIPVNCDWTTVPTTCGSTTTILKESVKYLN